jgi:hypothetical protein
MAGRNDEGPGPAVRGLQSSMVGGSSVLRVGSDARPVAELVGLVLERHRDVAESIAVLAGVVGAEVQLTARLELDAEVGLRTAAVAAICSAQRGCTGGNGSSHIGLISAFSGVW